MLHSFTRNYNDLSTDAGFQFEFYCDCCGNGVKSSFVESKTYGKRQKSERMGGLASTIGGSSAEKPEILAGHWRGVQTL